MWIKKNINPCGRVVGDCVVRALGIALGISWEDSFDLLTDAARKMCDLPSSNGVLGAVLRMHGFYMSTIEAGDYYTAADFAADNPFGVYVLGFGTHVATVIDGNIYDAWDSSNEIPKYVWYRED